MISQLVTGLTLRQWAQLVLGAVIIAVLIWAGLSFQNLRHEAAKVPGLEKEVATRTAELKQLRTDYDATQAASKGFQDELTRLKDAVGAAGPIPVVRVCKPAKPVSASTPAQPGSNESPPTGGVLPQEPGPDIGPALYGDADLADTLSAQIRGLEDYIRNVCLKGQ